MDLSSYVKSLPPVMYVRTADPETFIAELLVESAKVEGRRRTRKVYYYTLPGGLRQLAIDVKKPKQKKDEPSIDEVITNIESDEVTGNGISVTHIERKEIVTESKTGMSAYRGNLNLLLSDFANPQIKPFKNSVLLLRGIDRDIMNNTALLHNVIDLCINSDVIYQRGSVSRCLMIVSARVEIPRDIEHEVVLFKHQGLSKKRIIEVLATGAKNVDKNAGMEQLSEALAGLSYSEIASAMQLTINDRPELVELNKGNQGIIGIKPEGIQLVKGIRKTIVNKRDILEMRDPVIDLAAIGGNNTLKEYVKECATITKNYHEAKKRGVMRQRGILLLGAPGTGKTILTEALASEIECPFMILNLSKVMEARVGMSEANIEMAMDTAERIGGVLQIDEIEKKLGGVESSNKVDGGITMRIFDTIMRYMARDNDIIFVATANDIEGLPPELTRKGRIDEIFYVDYPTPEEVVEIMHIHYNKRGITIGKHLNEAEEMKMAGAMKEFTGAEIEYVVNKSLRKSYASGEDLKAKLIHGIIKEMVPMSRVHNERIERVRAWAVPVAQPASSSSSFAAKRKEYIKGEGASK